MKAATACILSCVAFATIAAGPPRKIACGRDGHIWVANIDGTAKKKLVGGGAPILSSDDARIAFDSTPRSAYENAARGADDPKRQITVLDIASGKITILKDIPSDQWLDPVWSPDGKWIAFQSGRGSPDRQRPHRCVSGWNPLATDDRLPQEFGRAATFFLVI
jgi:TolB protein